MDLMLDIETLGNEPGCVVLQMACVAFDPYAAPGQRHGDLPLAERMEFNKYISIQSCLNAGLTIQEETLKYWLRQSADTRDTVFYGQTDLYAALYDFEFFMKRITTSDYERLWVRGVTFDLPIVNAAYKAIHGFNKAVPWAKTFRKVHEVRTIMDFCRLKPEALYKDNRHNALVDCYNQINDVRRCFAQQNEFKPIGSTTDGL